MEKTQIMQRFIVKVLIDNEQKFKELERKSEALFHELGILDTCKTRAKRLRLRKECEESCSKNAANIVMVQDEETHTSSAFLSKTDKDTTFILDTGCKGAYICKNSDLLANKQQRAAAVTIEGISGHTTTATMGTYPLKEKLSACQSVRELIKGGVSFQGNEKSLTIYDANGKPIAHGSNKGDGFWTCTLK
jgi:hypothetical protein